MFPAIRLIKQNKYNTRIVDNYEKEEKKFISI